MDTTQDQIRGLDRKIDGLYQITEQINGHLTKILTEIKVDASSYPVNRTVLNMGSGYSHGRSAHASLEHKDILADDDNLDILSQSNERNLSPEIQIQRLTAQLTAAYNRIASLEEQLLSQRVH